MSETGPASLVTVYSDDRSLASTQVREYLSLHGIPFADRNWQRQPAYGQELRARIGYITAPVTFVGADVIYGFDRERLRGLLTVHGLMDPRDPRP